MERRRYKTISRVVSGPLCEMTQSSNRSELAERFGISQPAILQWDKRGRLPADRVEQVHSLCVPGTPIEAVKRLAGVRS